MHIFPSLYTLLGTISIWKWVVSGLSFEEYSYPGLPDESVAVHETWWRLFEANQNKMDDADFLLDLVMNEIRPVEPDIEIISAKLKIMSSILLGWNRLLNKRPQSVSEFLLKGLIEYLAKGFQHYKNAL